jgi:hypothetical protein
LGGLSIRGEAGRSVVDEKVADHLLECIARCLVLTKTEEIEIVDIVTC